MSNEKIIEVLRSGNFTVVYNDNGQGTIYKGKDDEYGSLKSKNRLMDFDDNDGNGYTPLIVQILVRALTGKTLSI